MDEISPRSLLWNKAGKSGFLLGIMTIAFMLASSLSGTLLGGAESFGSRMLGNFLGILLWVAKIVSCILLMRYFLKRLVAEYPAADNADTLKYGIRIALFSSLIVIAYNIADVLLIHPDMYADSIRQMMEQFSSMMDSNTLEMMEKMTGRMPVYVFFVLFLYNFVWGWILSIILSRNIPSRDPFSR